MPLVYPQWEKASRQAAFIRNISPIKPQPAMCERRIICGTAFFSITHDYARGDLAHKLSITLVWKILVRVRYQVFLSEWIKNDSLTTLDYELYLPTKNFFK